MNGPALRKRSDRPVVLTFIRHYVPGYRWGGPIRSLSNLVDHLGAEIDFRIVTTDRDYGYDTPYEGIPPGEWTEVGQASVLYLPPGSLGWRRISSLLERIAPSAIYLQSFFDPRFTLLPLLANRALRQDGFPTLIAPRGEFSPGALELKRLKKRVFIGAVRVLGLYDRVRWHASAPEEAADIQRELGVDAGHVGVAPNLPSPSGYRSSSPNRPPPAEEGVLRICFIARITAKKNLSYALEVLRQVNAKVEFTIFGPVSDPGYWERCQGLIRALPANVRARYGGELTPGQVPEEFARHHLFFFPTMGENFGHVILEALASRTPVLIGDETPWKPREKGIQAYPLAHPDRFRSAVEEAATWSTAEFHEARSEAQRVAASVLFDPEAVEANRALFLAPQSP